MSDGNNEFRFPRRKDTPPAERPAEPRLRLWQARAALLWERVWPAVWVPVAIAGAFVAVALMNLLPLLPGWLHAVVLVLFAAAFALTLARGLRGLRLPNEEAARRRLERDSGLPHRPLHALRDRAAGSDPTAAALWQLHQERVRAAMRNLRVAWPMSDIAAHDRYALRALVVLALIAVGGATWGDWRPRLAAALNPHLGGSAGASVAALDLWVTPPEYTGLPPIFLKSASAAHAPALPNPVPVPKGSLVLARVSGGSGTPTLEAGDRSASFEAVDSATFQIQQPIESGQRIAVTQGPRTLGSWAVQVIPDAPPTVAFASPPAKGERGALRLDYAAHDDYGLAEVKGVVRLAVADGEAPTIDRKPVELPLALPGVRPKDARNADFHDLTSHPWAGLNVALRITATDGAGQTGSTEEFPMVLPERVFNHPVARAIVEERKTLTLRPKESRVEVARALAELSARPGLFGGDIVAFLALRTSVGRLLLDEEGASIPDVQKLLWETALRIEDGGLSLAERDLRDAQQRLAEAMDRNASDEELKKLMDELQQAMDKFMEAMEQQLREAMERGEQIPMVPPEMADRMMDRQDLQQMMDQMRQMAETGARDAARQMLSQLQQMLENMRSGAMAQMQQQGGQNEAWEMMRELQELAQKQQQLLDQTFRQQQDQMGQQDGQQPQAGQGPRSRQGRQSQGQQGQGQQGQTGSPLMQQQAEQQEALRRQLGELMRRMGEAQGDIPRPLGRAERAMRDAGQALQQGQPGNAVPSQTQAMDELQQGMQSYAEQMMQQMMGQQGPAMMGQQQGQPQRQGRNRDPLGRRPSGYGNYDNNDVKIPEEAELQRAREILDELRRRSGQYTRPQMEREYIERLLKQF